jgi:hypothetical protein
VSICVTTNAVADKHPRTPADGSASSKPGSMMVATVLRLPDKEEVNGAVVLSA